MKWYYIALLLALAALGMNLSAFALHIYLGKYWLALTNVIMGTVAIWLLYSLSKEKNN